MQLKELFDSIAPQNAENRTVAKSLPAFLKYSVKCLFLKRLCQTVENLKYALTATYVLFAYFDTPIYTPLGFGIACELLYLCKRKAFFDIFTINTQAAPKYQKRHKRKVRHIQWYRRNGGSHSTSSG